MRNWASAAHPNQTDITGLQLISWLGNLHKGGDLFTNPLMVLFK